MKRILYVTTVSRTINAFLIPHIKMLIDEGNVVDCACCIDKEIDESLVQSGVKVYNIPFTRNPFALRNIRALIKLFKLQKKNRYNIIHVHTPIAALYGRLLKLRYRRLKTLYTVHGFHFYKGAPLKNWLIYYPIERIMAKLTDTIITMN
ncbi:MAG: glycosyltransferase, partial [Clostridiaceae bacterium]|nr:glycosyltransferase [Clostridiaceae bacterium]